MSTVATAPAPVKPEKPLGEQIAERFFINGLSFPGRDHVHGEFKGNGNQDCFGRRVTDKGIILISSDGCGSTPDSSTGSRAAVRIILNAAQQILEENEKILSPEDFAKELQQRLLQRIRQAAEPLSITGDIDNILHASYLFTVLVGIVTPDWTAVMGCGDGFFQVNGQIEKIPPREDNHPEYISYSIFGTPPKGFEDVTFKVFKKIDTRDLKTLMVATDGVEPIVLKEKRGFILADLWVDKTYRNPAAVAERFRDLSEDKREFDVKRRNYSVTTELITTPGIFHDDTTFVLLMTNSKFQFPTAWNDYRKANGLEVVEEKPAPVAKQNVPAQPVQPVNDKEPDTGKPAAADQPKTEPADSKPVKKGFWKWLSDLWASILKFIDTPIQEPKQPTATDLKKDEPKKKD